MFPIRGKISKPGFRVAEIRNPGKPGFWNESDFAREKLNVILKPLLLVNAQFISEY